MTAVSKRKDRDDNNQKPTLSGLDPYAGYSVNELLDERNYLKSQGMGTEEVDKILKTYVYSPSQRPRW